MKILKKLNFSLFESLLSSLKNAFNFSREASHFIKKLFLTMAGDSKAEITRGFY